MGGSMTITTIILTLLAVLLVALAVWKGNGKRRPMVKRPDRLTIDHKLETINEKMKGIGV
jgi:hypothetical protein